MSPRLTLALEDGGLRLPDGPIAVLHPRADQDLSALPKDRVRVVQPFHPDYQAWSGRGYDCAPALDGDGTVAAPGPRDTDASGASTPAAPGFAAALVCLPRAKAQARGLIAQAAGCAGLVIVDGLKTDGVDSLLKDVRKRVDVSGPISKAHGKIFWFTPSASFADWQPRPATVDGFVTAPGVFSADGIDPASEMLASVLPDSLGKTVADLGAGWGYLSAEILTRADVQCLHVVEADRIALDCARQNLPDPRARFHWADATQWRPEHPVDTVVMNPPFHTARQADLALGQAFVAAAAAMLKPSGTLWMVVNRHLPYEPVLRQHFATGDELAGDARYKLFRATRSSRPRR